MWLPFAGKDSAEKDSYPLFACCFLPYLWLACPVAAFGLLAQESESSAWRLPDPVAPRSNMGMVYL